MYFSKFSDAIQSLLDTAKQVSLKYKDYKGDTYDEKTGLTITKNELQCFITLNYSLAEYIKTGEKFYVPDSTSIIEGKVIDSVTKEFIRLPFDRTVLLSESFINNEDAEKFNTWKISIALSANEIRKISPSHIDFDDTDFAIFSVILLPDKMWAIDVGAICKLPKDKDGLELYEINNPWMERLSKVLSYYNKTLKDEINDDLMSICNLCLMLGLKNVSTKGVNPDVKLNKARAARGNLPFYSYHVLKVDNEVWDKHEHANSKEFYGRRAHLRRGHIRRLQDGRRVFVKSAMVKGSILGFVDKEYHLK